MGFFGGVPTQQHLLSVFVGTFFQSLALSALFHGRQQFGVCPEPRCSRVRTCSAALAPELGAKDRAEASAPGAALMRFPNPRAALRLGRGLGRGAAGRDGVGRSTGAGADGHPSASQQHWLSHGLLSGLWLTQAPRQQDWRQKHPRSPHLLCAPASRSSPPSLRKAPGTTLPANPAAEAQLEGAAGATRLPSCCRRARQHEPRRRKSRLLSLCFCWDCRERGNARLD